MGGVRPLENPHGIAAAAAAFAVPLADADTRHECACHNRRKALGDRRIFPAGPETGHDVDEREGAGYNAGLDNRANQLDPNKSTPDRKTKSKTRFFGAGARPRPACRTSGVFRRCRAACPRSALRSRDWRGSPVRGRGGRRFRRLPGRAGRATGRCRSVSGAGCRGRVYN